MSKTTRNPDELHAETNTPCLEITARFGETVLSTKHLSPPRSFYVGESSTSGPDAGPIDLLVPRELTGASRVPLVVVHEGRVWLISWAGARGLVSLGGGAPRALLDLAAESTSRHCEAHPGAFEVELPAGSEASFDFGALSFTVRTTTASNRIARYHVHSKGLLFQVGSALFHACAIAGLAMLAVTHDPEEISPEQIEYMQRAIQATEAKQLEEAAAEEARGAPPIREGSSGASARFGVRGGGDDSYVARQAALRDANEFGMVGLLNSGAGNDPNAPFAPWGRDDSVGASKSVGPTPLPSAPPSQSVKIDPNGRFATTYRPGGGHLAAFESALSRGIVGDAEREIVSDIGARYAPVLPPPEGKALGFRADLERTALAPGGGPFHLRLALQSTAAPSPRPHLSVHLVLDVSGSMQGDSIEHARQAARAVVDKLHPTDDFSFVTFSSGANVVVPDGPVGERRAAIKKVIDETKAGGGTNIGEGLRLGYLQATLPSIPESAVRVVLLVSDGRATVGLMNSEDLSLLSLNAFQKGIQTSAFGLGSDYDGALMSSIANDGAGGYYYLRDAQQIAPALAAELDKRLDPVATAVEVRVRLAPDVELQKVYGSRRLDERESQRAREVELAADAHAEKRHRIARDRKEDMAGGMRFLIPAFARGDAHALLFGLNTPPGVGKRRIATIELRYKDRTTKTNVIEEIPVSAAFADSDAASARAADPSVARTVQGFQAGETLSAAAKLVQSGDRARAASILVEREEILKQAAVKLDEPLFLKDAERFARFRSFTGTGGGAGDPLVLSMLLETAGRAHQH